MFGVSEARVRVIAQEVAKSGQPREIFWRAWREEHDKQRVRIAFLEAELAKLRAQVERPWLLERLWIAAKGVWK